MRKAVLLAMLGCFIFNTFVVSAWTSPYIMNMAAGDVMQNMGGDMLCQGDASHHEQQKHCEGLCLCLHASLSQTPTLIDTGIDYIPDDKDGSWSLTYHRVSALSTGPPKPPPRLLS